MMIESGSILLLRDIAYDSQREFLVERYGNYILLANSNLPYNRLTLSTSLSTEEPKYNSLSVLFEAKAPFLYNLFSLENITANICMLVINVKIKGCNKIIKYALGITKNATLTSIIIENQNRELNLVDNISYKFKLSVIEYDLYSNLRSERKLSIYNTENFYLFQKWQLRRFIHEGYIHIPNLIDDTSGTTNSILRLLDHHLGVPGYIIPGGVQSEEKLGKFSGEMSNCGIIRKLIFRDKLDGLLNAIFGINNYEKDNISAQIAYRFPELNVNKDTATKPIVWHTDDFRQGKTHSFSLLLGVCLSAIRLPNSGNLCIWPGSHLLLHQCKYGPHGAIDFEKLKKLKKLKHFDNFDHASTSSPIQEPILDNNNIHTNTHTLLDNNNIHNNTPIVPCLGDELQMILNKGDVVLLHPDLAHAGAPNYSSKIRKMLYFRIKIKVGQEGHPQGITSSSSSCFQSWDQLVSEHNKDLWIDLPVLKNKLGQDELQNIMKIYNNNDDVGDKERI